MKNKFLLIDGNILMFQSFFASFNPDRPERVMKNSAGIATNGINLFFLTFLRLVNEVNPKYLFIAFDANGKTKRHEQFEEYKGKRTRPPEDIYEQFKWTKKILELLKIPHNEILGSEADDLIATLTTIKDIDKIIFSKDKDLLQLVDDETSVITNDTKNKKFNFTTIDNFYSMYGINPDQIPDYKGLAGDSVDNLPGIRGIGPKTAISLLNKYKTFDNLYNNIDDISKDSIRNKLVTYKDSGFLSYSLAKLDKNVENLSKKLEDYVFSPDVENSTETLDFLELKKIKIEIEKIKKW